MCVVCCVLCVVCCVLCVVCCVCVVLCVLCCFPVSLLFNACGQMTKSVPDAPSPRRILTQTTAQELYTPVQTQSPPRVSPSSMNSCGNFMRRPPYPNSAARCCRVRQVLLKQPLHAQLNSITSFTIADVVSSQRQDTLLGAFCSIPALSITVSFSTFSSLLVNTCFTNDTLKPTLS